MQSILQVLKVSPVTDREYEGRKYQTQDAECLLLDEQGEVDVVGVLRIPQELHGKVDKGTYRGTFKLKADNKTRRIVPILVGVEPYVKAAPAPAPVDKTKP